MILGARGGLVAAKFMERGMHTGVESSPALKRSGVVQRGPE